MAQIIRSSESSHSPYNGQGSRFLTVTIVLGLFSILSVILRVVARRLSRNPLGFDDLFSFISLVACAIASGVGLWMGYNGAGAQTMLLDQSIKYFKGYYILMAVYPICPAAGRISVLLLYNRIFSPKRAFRVIARGVAILNAIWYLANTCSGIFWCWPISAFWDHRLMPTAACLPGKLVHIILTLLDGCLDLSIIALATCVSKSLHMSRSKKVGIFLIFMLAGCASLISLSRATFGFHDTATFSNNLLWILVYCHFAVLCPCVPTLGPLFKETYWVEMQKSWREYASRLRSITLRAKPQKAVLESNMDTHFGCNDFSHKNKDKTVVIIHSVQSVEKEDDSSCGPAVASDLAEMGGDLEACR